MFEKRAKKILKKMGLKYDIGFFDKLTKKQKYKFNELKQRKIFKKKFDYFSLEAAFDQGDNIFKYKSLRDWDYKIWKNLMKDQVDLNREYEGLYIYESPFRVIEKEEAGSRSYLTYGMLQSAEAYISLSVYDMLSKYINKKYPVLVWQPYNSTTFIQIENSENYTMIDYENRAAGFEKEREKLLNRLRNMWKDIEEVSREHVKPFENYTFRLYQDSKFKEDIFIIGGIGSAERISFKKFMYDFRELEQPIEVLDKVKKIVFKKFKKSF